MPSKLRIKLGSAEFEYEGEAEFTQEEIKDLFSHIEKLSNVIPPPPPISRQLEKPSDQPLGSNLGIVALASRLKVANGPQLIIAAAAHYSIQANQSTFTKKELITLMKSAGGFYRKSYENNLGASLERLVRDGTLNDHGPDKYSLSNTKREELVGKIAS